MVQRKTHENTCRGRNLADNSSYSQSLLLVESLDHSRFIGIAFHFNILKTEFNIQVPQIHKKSLNLDLVLWQVKLQKVSEQSAQ